MCRMRATQTSSGWKRWVGIRKKKLSVEQWMVNLEQCCGTGTGTSDVDPRKKCLDPNPKFFFGFWSLYYYFDPKFFKMVTLIAFMCSGICSTEKKVFQLKNLRFSSYKCLICDLSPNCLFYNSCLDLDPNPNPNRNLFFRFGFGSSQSIRIISDSDPQHWLELYVAKHAYFFAWMSF
jgi:hypothetical protein